MIEQRENLPLMAEAREQIVRIHSVFDDLYGDFLPKIAFAERAVNDSHPPAADLFGQPVRSDQSWMAVLRSPWRGCASFFTPDYASPEQVLGERITTATDVYSLGAVLYELLTRAKVHRIANTSFAELERAVCLAEPPRPSDSPGAKREVRGDLDTIVVKALPKPPERRYLHVEQLAEDIGRYLEGQPVLARPDTLRYRAGKFCRRNKAATAAVAVVLVTLIAGVIGVSWQARVARRERAVAERRFNDVRRFAGSMIFEVDREISQVAGAHQGPRIAACTQPRISGPAIAGHRQQSGIGPGTGCGL